jgi:uncharacterized protein (DUF1499 family)
MKTVLMVLLALVLVAVSLLALRSYLSRSNPPTLGVSNGMLTPCGERPNCVSSQAKDEAHQIAPLPYVGDRAATQARLQQALSALPNINDVERRDDYWHLTQTSNLFRFLDDIEFVFDDAAAQVRVRSGSRVGYSDMGVNRKRVEALRAAMQ